MASPFSIFRKNQKVMLAVIGVAAMIAFVFLGPISQFMGSGPSQGDNPVVVETSFGDLRAAELQALEYQRALVERFIQSVVVQSVAKQFGQPGMDNRWLDSIVQQQYLGWRNQIMGRSSAGPEKAAVETMVLAERARQMGLVVTDETINEVIKQLSGNAISTEEMRQIIGSLQPQRPVSVNRLFDALRTELLATQYQNFFTTTLSDVPPAQRYEYYTRLNRRAKVELLPLAVSDFVAQVSDPSDAEVQEFYEKYKNDYPNPASPEPGFKKPQRATFQFFKGSTVALGKELEDQVTEEEIEKFYAENRTRFPAPAASEDAAAGETPEGESPVEGAKPEGAEDATKPAAEKPADEKPADEKPADEKPADEKPADEAKSEEADKPAEEKPAEEPAKESPPKEESKEKPAEEKPAEESEPAESKTEEEKPADTDSADEPAEDKPASEEPAEEESPQANAGQRAIFRFASATLQEEESSDSGSEDSSGEKSESSGPALGDPDPAAEEKSSEEPAADEKSSEEKPAEDKPAEDKPTEDKPAEDKPAEDKPAEDKPAEEKPAEEKPAEEAEPSGDAPADEMPQEAAGGETPATDASPAAGDEVVSEPGVPEPQFATLDQVRDQIRTQLGQQKAGEILTEQFEQLYAAMRRYRDEYDVYSVDKQTDPSARPPAELDFAKLADGKHVEAGELKSVTPLEAMKSPLGRSERFVGNPNTGQGSTVPFVQFAFDDSLLEFSPQYTQDSEGETFLFWKTSEEPAYVPPLDEIRDEVVRAWKMIKARELAEKRAEEYAEQARKQGKPLSEVFGSQPDLKVVEAGPFSWMTLGNVPMQQGAVPRLSEVEGVDQAGPGFMRTVFGLKDGELGVAFNEPRDLVYVVRAAEFTPSQMQLREEFARETPNRYMAAAIDDQRAIYRDWVEELNAEADVHWLRQADIRSTAAEEEGEY